MQNDAFYVIAGLPPSDTAATETGGGATATTQGAAGGQTVPPKPQPGLFDNPLMLMAILGLVLVYVFMARGKGKGEKQRLAMLKEMKKGDKVLTTSGMVASIVDIRDDDDMVVLKVDESNNTKAKFLKSAIVRVLGDDEKMSALAKKT